MEQGGCTYDLTLGYLRPKAFLAKCCFEAVVVVVVVVAVERKG
jgi:hypothetical protein